MTGLLIYEDNDNLRESLEHMITHSPDLLLLGGFPAASHAVAQVVELRPDLILMDIDMPGLNGIEAVRQIRAVDGNVLIIMLTIFDDNRHVLDAICAGASGYLLKKHIAGHLTTAIAQVMQGEAPMSPGIARIIINSMQQGSHPVTNRYNLTAREKEILTQLSGGRGLKQMAAALTISLDTVRTHIKNIYGKLQVHTQTEAVAKALNERLT